MSPGSTHKSSCGHRTQRSQALVSGRHRVHLTNCLSCSTHRLHRRGWPAAAERQRRAATARKEIGIGDRGEPVRTAVGYIRVSTDMQASEGISPEAQHAAIWQYRELHRTAAA